MKNEDTSLEAAAPEMLLNLQEMHILHYGTAAELADQRERWNGLSAYEIAHTLDGDARAAIAKATKPADTRPKGAPNSPPPTPLPSNAEARLRKALERKALEPFVMAYEKEQTTLAAEAVLSAVEQKQDDSAPAVAAPFPDITDLVDAFEDAVRSEERDGGSMYMHGLRIATEAARRVLLLGPTKQATHDR